MDSQKLSSALNFIQEIKSLFPQPNIREEEEIHHLLSAVQWRIHQLSHDHNKQGQQHHEHDR
ncbi:TPA: hypothetical protein ACGQS5_004799 [Serratia liquefaciens]